MVLSTVEDTGNGATLTFGTSSFAVRIKKINGWEDKIEMLEVTNLSTTGRKKRIASDLKEFIDISYEFYWDTTKAIPTLGATPETITVTFPIRTNGGEATGANYAGTGVITSIKFPDLANGEVQMGTLTVSYDGTTGPTFTIAS